MLQNCRVDYLVKSNNAKHNIDHVTATYIHDYLDTYIHIRIHTYVYFTYICKMNKCILVHKTHTHICANINIPKHIL